MPYDVLVLGMLFRDCSLRIEESPWPPRVLGSLDEESGGMPGERLPLIGEQFPKPSDRVAHDAAEHVVEVLPRVNAAGFAGLYQPKI